MASSRQPAPEDDVALLRELLLSDARAASLRPGSPKLLMLAGLPGAGKSTFAREVTSRCPFLTLESDRLRKSLVSEPQYTPDEHRRVFRACHRLLDELLGQGYPLIFDATNLTERNRRPVYSIVRKRGVPFSIAVVTAPPEIVRQRLRDREAGLDPETWSDAGVGHPFPNGPGVGAGEAPAYWGGYFRGYNPGAPASAELGEVRAPLVGVQEGCPCWQGNGESFTLWATLTQSAGKAK